MMKFKRFKIAVLSLILLCSMAAVSVSASYGCEYLGDLPEVKLGVDVDAVKDDVYDNALCLELNRQYPGEDASPNGTSGKAWLVYYNNYLYAYVEIYDSDIVIPTESTQNSTPWETDSVEIFLNAKNSDDDSDTIQHRIDVTGFPSIYSQTGINDYGPAAVGDRFEYAQCTIEGGYAVEFGFLTDSRTFGIQMQINDKTSDGKLYHIMSASEFESESWTADLYPWTSVDGEGRQTEAETDPVTEPETNAATDAETKVETKNETKAETKANSAETESGNDDKNNGVPMWGIILIAVAAVAVILAVILVCTRKKKNA